MVFLVDAVPLAMVAVMPDYKFTTDGCSGGMSWCWRKLFNRNPPWERLCIDHDKDYWRGGTAEDRQWADAGLLIGIAPKGYPFIAILMWLAVRIGGHPLLPFPWRWGYGWRWPRWYFSDLPKVDDRSSDVKAQYRFKRESDPETTNG